MDGFVQEGIDEARQSNEICQLKRRLMFVHFNVVQNTTRLTWAF